MAPLSVWVAFGGAVWAGLCETDDDRSGVGGRGNNEKRCVRERLFF